jgi:hypothetical protein
MKSFLFLNIKRLIKIKYIIFGLKIPFKIRSCGMQNNLKYGKIFFRINIINKAVSPFLSFTIFPVYFTFSLILRKD